MPLPPAHCRPHHCCRRPPHAARPPPRAACHPPHAACRAARCRCRTARRPIRRTPYIKQRCKDALGCWGCFYSSATAAEELNGTTTISYPTAKSNEFCVRVARVVGPRKNVLCISLRLPLEVQGVENLLISERGSSNISRNPA
jgi:hypothetical protein